MIPDTMRAIRVMEPGGPEVLRAETVPVPIPNTDEALVRIEAIGVNFIDIYQRSGLYNVPMPATPGSEAAGIVVAVGDHVTDVRVGDRVAYEGVRGAYAEYAVVPASVLVPVPDGVTTRQAAAVMLQGMTAHYLATSTHVLQAGEQCLIHAAAGGVGLLFCQIASLRGARVIGTASTEAKMQQARDAGAHEMINYTTHDFAAEVKRLTNGGGVDVVYDSVGKTTFEKSLDCLKPRGLMVLFGQSSGPVLPVNLQILNQKGSLYVTRPTLGHYVATREELLWRSGDLFTWMRDGKLTVHIGKEFPLSDARRAHEALAGRKTTGKVLLIP
jgi:NADPH2:quinone reductase